ncbi:MAG: DNA polymerase I [Bacteroidales bacterium]|nr:DNA polymerase I [Bacteroidales bacterium]
MTKDSEKRLFLLDAYALIYRAYYAFIRNPRINSKGFNTSAIFGFTNSLLEILSKDNPTHIAVVFDPSGPTFRHEQYPDYKAHRDETPEDIRKSIPYIKQLIEAMNIPVIVKDGFEADDVIGTLSVKASQNGFTTYMVTPDKDYAQLVNDKVFMYKPRSKGGDIDIWGVDEIKENFSVDNPLQIIDILALWGDSADNIPGCPGIGEKRAKELISEFKSISGIYENINSIKGKLKENLENFKQQVELSYHLVTINTEVSVEFNENELLKEKPNMEHLMSLFDELEFKTLGARIRDMFAPPPAQGSLFDMPVTTEVVKSEPMPSKYKSIHDVNHSYYLIDNEMAIMSLVSELSLQKEFCFDTETTSIDIQKAELVGISFSFKAHEGYYVPIPTNQDEAFSIVQSFADVFTDNNILKIGQNIKFDISILNKYNIKVKGPFFDTMIAHYLINPGLKHNMDFLSETYLNYRPVEIEELIGAKGKKQGNMRDVPLEQIIEYAAEDADITFQLKEILKKEVDDADLTHFFETVELPLMEVLTDMEATGVRIDADELNNYAKELNIKLNGIEQNIKNIGGDDLNVSSPKQIGELLFEKLNLDPKAKTTKTGQYSTDEETLQKLKDKHEIISDILQYRGLKKLLSTYVEVLPTLINNKTKRLHTSYNQAIVVTGRLSSTNPNLQNIPIRDDEGREIRRAFVAADDDHIFLSADYSQVELRLMAHFSKDTHMTEAFRKGEDIHAATAAKIFNVSLDEVTSDMRRKAKTANFGIIYGISAFGLSERLNIPRGEAKALIDGYFENFPEVKSFMDKCIADARDKGYVSTLFGRKRYLPDINSRNAVVRGVAERNAINAPIQGTAADIIKIAMVKIFNAFNDAKLESKMILQVHDELNFDVKKSELEQVKTIVKDCMENAYKLNVPLEIDMGFGNNWLEAH